MGAIDKIYQALIKVFVRSNKRFPAGKELDDIEKQARQVFDGALSHNLDQAKGTNVDDIVVMEKTTEKSGDELIDDYLSSEAYKKQVDMPSFTEVDERMLPKAEIKALPLKDKEKAEAAVKKKLEAQNIQAKQAIEGGESSGAQRGRPELVKPGFGDTIYIDKADMKARMDEASRFLVQAEDAVSRGDFDEARAILRYQVAENYKYPKNVREAADDARMMIKRGEGIDWRKQGFDSLEEAQEELNSKIQVAINETSQNNYPDFTDPLEGQPQQVEYVGFFDEPGEDFGTPNSTISNIEDFEFADGGRVNAAAGGLLNRLRKMYPKRDLSDFEDLIEQAKKAGVKIETPEQLENFQKQIQETSSKIYESRKKYPGVEGEKSGLPLDENLRELTEDEIDDLVGEVGDLDAYDFDGTVGSANRIKKEQKEYMDYMYDQYKTGKLDPQPGEKSRSRMKYLQAKKEEAEMTDDFRLFTPDDRDELEFLEAEFEYKDLREKLDSPRKMTNEDLKKLKEFDDSGFEDFSKEMNRINRNKKAKGGLGYLMGF
jgi:hypothetical protein